MSKKSTIMTVIAILAVAQAVFGVLRAFDWFHIGSDLMGQGLLLIPLIGVIAYGRGLLVIAIGLLYLLFAWGIFMFRGWAWSLGMVVAIINILLVLSVLVQGESILIALFGLIVPSIIVWYLLSPAGREVFKTEAHIGGMT